MKYDNDFNEIRISDTEYINSKIKPIVTPSDINLTVSGGGTPLSNYFSMPAVPANATVEFRGVFLVKFANGDNGNVVTVSLPSPEALLNAVVGINYFVNASTGGFAQITDDVSTSSSPAMADLNVHTILVSGVITGGNAISSPTIRIANASATITMTILAKSFIKYSIL